MHLFAPERPELAPHVKVLLIDGSAIPRFLVEALPDQQVLLSAMLRKYDDHGGYAYYQVELPSQELSLFFSLFHANPEQALEDYFNWMPKKKTNVTVIPITAQQPINEDFL